MERVSNKHQENYPSVTLYLDDLIEIIDAFSQACKNIEITANEYKIRDPKELNQLADKCNNNKFKDLQIEGQSPFISLSLRSYGAQTYISQDTLEQRGVIAKISEVLHRRQKVRPDLMADLACIALILSGAWIIFTGSFLIGGLTLGAGAALVSYSSHLRMNNRVIVYSKNRNELKSFFHRKQDEILLVIISAAIGSALTYFLT